MCCVLKVTHLIKYILFIVVKAYYMGYGHLRYTYQWPT